MRKSEGSAGIKEPLTEDNLLSIFSISYIFPFPFLLLTSDRPQASGRPEMKAAENTSSRVIFLQDGRIRLYAKQNDRKLKKHSRVDHAYKENDRCKDDGHETRALGKSHHAESGDQHAESDQTENHDRQNEQHLD
jgi:hypothetical protein